MFFRIFRINPSEQRTFILHMIYSILDGLVLGIFALNEYILIKSLKGTNYQVGFLVQFTVIVLIFSIILTILLKKIRRKKRMIRYVGIITRLPLFLFIFFPVNITDSGNILFYQIILLLIFLVYYMATPLIYPAINHLLKNSYSHENFGRLYGYASTINKVMMLVSTFLFGLMLDYDQGSYRYIYPLVAVFGIVAIFYLTKIQYEYDETIETGKGFIQSIKDSWDESIAILKKNRPFRDFENAFFLYGLAWMATSAVIPIFFDKYLHLNYSTVAFYKNFYNIISILIIPYLGKLINRIDPRKFAVFTFSSMLLHILFMTLTEFIPLSFSFFGIEIYYTLIVSYIWYGLFGAMMGLLWSIGSVYFCSNEEVSSYQAIHLSLTGIRGALAPLLGIFLYEIIGYAGVFIASMISLVYAVYIMIFSMKKYEITLSNEAKRD